MSEGMDRDPAILASVVIPTLNAGDLFSATLEGIRSQRIDGEVEIVVVDSGSRDATVDRARKAGARVREILPEEFDHGNTRNLGAGMARGEYLVFLSQDAVPANERWLEHLLSSMREDETVAGAYSRVLPQPGDDLVTRRLVVSDINHRDERIEQRSPGAEAYRALDPHAKRLLINFNDVASAMRRSVWEALPLPRCRFAEDLLWGKAVIEAGLGLVFENRSVVRHSHVYDDKTLYRRAFVDGLANRRILDRYCIRNLLDVARTARNVSREDAEWIRATGDGGEDVEQAVSRIRRIRLVQMWGLYRGSKAEGEPLPTPAPVPPRRLKILFVVHGFPPQTRAGTEVYTLNLARELQRRHEVTVFHRCEDLDAPNYSLQEDTVEGLRVFRVVNNLAYHGIQETFKNVAVESRFREVLGTVRPDLVHFQHCLHTSVSLIDIAAEHGLPSLLTLHDYWFICPKVQLIQTHGKICPETRPGIGCVRCARDRTPLVEVGKAATFALYPFLVLFLRIYPGLIRRFRFLERRIVLDLLALFRRRKTLLASLRKLELMISPSPFLKGKYEEFGVDPERIIFSRNGLDTGHLEGISKREGKTLRVAFMGSFVWYKGLHVLSEAFSHLEGEPVELHVYGDDGSREELRTYRERVENAGPRQGIFFHGPFQSAKLPEIYAQVDVLVVPSLWFENAPMVIFEAFASGTPVIATRLGGMANFVQHEVNGLLFTANDAEDLARTLRRCVDERDLLDRLKEGIPRVKSVADNVREMEVYYRQALGQKRGPVQYGEDRIPDIDIQARRYATKHGAVDHQGEEFVLLRPNGTSPSSVLYRFEVPAAGEYTLEVRTALLQGEARVKVAGKVFINGTVAGGIPEHGFESGGSLERRFRFRCQLKKGRNVLKVDNTHLHPEVEGQYHVRLSRVLFFSSVSLPESMSV